MSYRGVAGERGKHSDKEVAPGDVRRPRLRWGPQNSWLCYLSVSWAISRNGGERKWGIHVALCIHVSAYMCVGG